MNARIVRAQHQSLTIVDGGRIEILPRLECVSEIYPGAEKIGGQRQGFFVAGDGFVMSTALHHSVGETQVRIGEIRSELHGPLVVDDGFVDITLLVQHRSKTHAGVQVVGPKLHRPATGLGRFADLMGGHIGLGQIVEQLGPVGGLLNRPLHQLDGRTVATGLMLRDTQQVKRACMIRND